MPELASAAYKEIDNGILSELNLRNPILLVTATNLETDILHKHLHPLPNSNSIFKLHIESHYYYIAKFGLYPIIHVQCGNMGAIGRASSILTISHAISQFKPRATVMIGIAFGVKEDQKIGDVLISEVIQPYDSKRVGKEKSIPRGVSGPASKLFLSRIRSLRLEWKHLLDDGNSESEMHIGLVLSGEELIDNKERRDELTDLYPVAIGGEMEGAGLFAACDSTCDWVLIKGICDFADGEKGINKKKNQIAAMSAAVSLSEAVFLSPTLFKDLIADIEISEGTRPCEVNLRLAQNVLFDIFIKEYEPYYVVRQCDAIVSGQLNMYGVWLFGPSGCGKSNLIIRTIVSRELELCSISLGSYIGEGINSLFAEIYLCIAEKLGQEVVPPREFVKIQKAIVNVLKNVRSPIVIYLEELPMNTEEEFKEFIQKLNAILIELQYNQSPSFVKFVLSSIEDPRQYIPPTQNKIKSYLKFVQLENWESKDILKLIDLICEALGIKLTNQEKDGLIGDAGGSPRFIKKCFQNLVALHELNGVNLKVAIAETKKDFSFT
ncbi:nucleoside phosphorylase [Filimonas zeae]|uniref:Nucleoside phosphorylase domain-containing protein n=1 Tax=Filimonas zeae TaxID=1737353 RepID=A0A917IP73_9BACT|nr:hypothetical protein [Filimonas zeae]MDR6337406.1 nucleoside phosphorylase [Filimonas zeae]GGH58457.1 hypothetical protein GCM10011379_04210 [Filimonas zeae]